ncbi:unnamed protein product [Spirodela intermedia]|uniref:Uncharacterized protein n=1 Tax=Spirodela intermedia TaxID=51605 RepID=A0A7I8L8N9_SPIIN|nr:unnamed protein product [Spirodela intermedia]
MEFPFGHQHHHRRGEEEEEEGRRGEERGHPPPGHQPYRPEGYGSRGGEEYQRAPHQHHGGGDYGYGGDSYQRPYPPPPHGGGYDSGPGFPTVQHVAHEVGPGSYQRPYPPAPHGGSYDSGPGFPVVQHVAHEVRPGAYERDQEGGRDHEGNRGHHGFPFVQHVSHESSGSGHFPANRRTVRIFTKAEENYSLTIREGKIILARANPNDEYQHWIKDEKFSTQVKDEEGLPCFALVNKVTGEAIKHSIGATHPVRLIPYNPKYLDESILWTESHDTGEGFRCIRMVNNIRLNFDAFHGDEDHGGVRDGTTVVLWEWLKGKNQRWKIVPYCKWLLFLFFSCDEFLIKVKKYGIR